MNEITLGFYGLILLALTSFFIEKKQKHKYKIQLSNLDLNKINYLIEIIKKEMKDIPDYSSLSYTELRYIKDYCWLLLNIHNSSSFKKLNYNYQILERNLAIKIFKFTSKHLLLK